MANGNGDAYVNYTVKELLTLAQERADERHETTLDAIASVDKKVTNLSTRTDKLEEDRVRRSALANVSNRALTLGAAFGILLINIPAMLVAAGKVGL